jgi:hypothetical protein
MKASGLVRGSTGEGGRVAREVAGSGWVGAPEGAGCVGAGGAGGGGGEVVDCVRGMETTQELGFEMDGSGGGEASIPGGRKDFEASRLTGRRSKVRVKGLGWK